MAYFDDKDELEELLKKLPPDTLERQIASGLELCWHLLPENERTITGLRNAYVRIVDTVLDSLGSDPFQY